MFSICGESSTSNDGAVVMSQWEGYSHNTQSINIEWVSNIKSSIKAILNSRPLSALILKNVDILNPYHLLIGRAMITLPEI